MNQISRTSIVLPCHTQSYTEISVYRYPPDTLFCVRSLHVCVHAAGGGRNSCSDDQFNAWLSMIVLSWTAHFIFCTRSGTLQGEREFIKAYQEEQAMLNKKEIENAARELFRNLGGGWGEITVRPRLTKSRLSAQGIAQAVWKRGWCSCNNSGRVSRSEGSRAKKEKNKRVLILSRISGPLRAKRLALVRATPCAKVDVCITCR